MLPSGSCHEEVKGEGVNKESKVGDAQYRKLVNACRKGRHPSLSAQSLIRRAPYKDPLTPFRPSPGPFPFPSPWYTFLRTRAPP